MSEMESVKRTYVQRARAEAAAETRASILAAARDLIPRAESGLGVDEIARYAGVAVQTIYDHFGSKGGLLMAVVDDVQGSTGLYDALENVFRSPDGETALRRMIDATLTFWHRAWPYIEFTLRSRRVDPVVGREAAVLDTLRHAHLWAICQRVWSEGRVRDGRTAAWAADQVFALTTPTVYEELVVRRAWSLRAATESIRRAATASVIRAGTTPLLSPAPDWVALEAAAGARAMRAGADPRRLSGSARGTAGSRRADADAARRPLG